jgi:multidrug resistance efflux pump
VQAARLANERTTLTVQPCTVHAFDQEEIFAPVPGLLKEVRANIGDVVKKGELLAVIGAPDLQINVQQAQALCQQARAQVVQAQANVRAVQAAVLAPKSQLELRKAEVASAEASMKFRKKQYERFVQLAKSGSIDAKLLDEKADQLEAARGKYDAAKAAVLIAEADVKIAESKVQQAEAELETTKANLAVTQATLAKAEHALSLTRIESPINGIVTRRNYQVGHFFRAAGEAVGQLPIFIVQRTDRVRVIVEVPNTDALLTHPGDPVELRFDALPDVRLTGYQVSRIGFALDPKTRTMRVEIDVPNDKRLLRPGMYGQAKIQVPKTPQDAK